ncbi:MAG: hypothetical protein WC661_14190 [Opitutaceae bacterium]|jgi:hypothetical protein
MKSVDPLIFLELHVVQKIIADETWLEGERRGCPVDPRDPVVVAVVCEIIARIGADLRASLMADREPRPEQPSDQNHPMAA